MGLKCLTLIILSSCFRSYAISAGPITDTFRVGADVKVTIDAPAELPQRNTIIIFYALPNGNTTEQTMGKRLIPGNDWHFDIQHIKAQTVFLRTCMKEVNIVVAYLENTYKSWPQWKKVHPDYASGINHILDTVYSLVPSKRKSVYLNGHSGGGSFIFGYLESVRVIPAYIKRISFIDSNYGYDSSYASKFIRWLKTPGKYLSVFAYNDSIAVYNSKPLVSATGGTWYRSKIMLTDLSLKINFTAQETDSLFIYKSSNRKIQFYLKKNPDHGIYHTQQVEKNGFIHSVLCGTKYEEVNYKYYGARAYENLIE